MLTCGEMALFFRASAVRVEAELTLETHKLLADIAKDAEALIGQERPQWHDLAPSTVAEKERLGYTNQISPTDPLLRTGEMRGSIESDAEKGDFWVDGVIGSNDKVALYQEMGTKTIPPRPFLAAAMIINLPKKSEVAFGEFGLELLTPGVR